MCCLSNIAFYDFAAFDVLVHTADTLITPPLGVINLLKKLKCLAAQSAPNLGTGC